MPSRTWTTVAVTALLAALSSTTTRPCRASGWPTLPEESFILLPGATFGGTSSFDVGTGFTLGGELSAVFWTRNPDPPAPSIVGVYGDVLYDWQREATRITLGPELAWYFVGIDGGYLIETDGEITRYGGAVRLFGSVGLASVFVRYGGLLKAPDFVEWGLQLKLPLVVWADSQFKLF